MKARAGQNVTEAPTFRDRHDQKIDAKGRVSIPADFRRIIEQFDPLFTLPNKERDIKGKFARIVVIEGDAEQAFLECYTMTGIGDIQAMIRGLEFGSDERELAEEYYYEMATEMEIDMDGRIILPMSLREKLQPADLLKFVGKGDRFQVWRPDVYADKRTSQNQAARERLGPRANPRALLQGRRAE